jgi:transcriptional regulator
MHPSVAFKANNDEALAIARAYPFAAISAFDGAGLVSVQAPLLPVTDEAGALVAFEGHLARANRFARQLMDGRTVDGVAVFSGPDAYISPSSYAGKAVGRVVPTWNFIAAEAHGHLTLILDDTETLAILARQTDVFEQQNNGDWSLDDADADYLARLTRAIVGLRLEITSLVATVKLSQDKAEDDFSGVMNGLLARDDYKARAIAARMSELERG